MTDFTYVDIAKMIDQALLQPTLTDAELERGCQVAREYDVASVCIKPYAVKLAVDLLAGSFVKVGTVIGFPHGGHMTAVKTAEAWHALNEGATELDVVVNVGKVLSEDWDYVTSDLRSIIEVAHQKSALVKVIFENSYLQDSHKEKLCQICGELRADFVKTATGYGEYGALDDDLKLMRRCSPAHVRIKAAGGVRNFARLLEVRQLGVSRVGATSAAKILDECKAYLGSS